MKRRGTYSLGLGEIQVRRAGQLLGLNISDEGSRNKVLAALWDDETSIELVALNIADYQRSNLVCLDVKAATVAHDGGPAALDSWLRGEVHRRVRLEIGARSGAGPQGRMVHGTTAPADLSGVTE